MKKSFYLISILISVALINSCKSMDNKKSEQNRESKSIEINNKDAVLKEESQDSSKMTNSNKIILDSNKTDTTTRKGKEIPPSKKSISKDSLISKDKPKAITHGSSEKAKIDSIKKAKAKLKK